MRHPASEFISTTEGPMGVVKTCRICGFYHYRPKHKGRGRGNGMREGNKSRGIIIQHIKAEHPESLTTEN